jgi:hypothetical protein
VHAWSSIETPIREGRIENKLNRAIVSAVFANAGMLLEFL